MDALVRSREHGIACPFPELTDPPERVIHGEEAILRELERSPRATYALYWNADGARSHQPSGAMLFFTSDGAMIAGIAIGIAIAETALEEWLEELARFTGARHATARSFRAARAEARCSPIDGRRAYRRDG